MGGAIPLHRGFFHLFARWAVAGGKHAVLGIHRFPDESGRGCRYRPGSFDARSEAAEGPAADTCPMTKGSTKMRWMLIMNVEPEAAARAAEEMDLAEMFAVMGAYNDDLQKAGVFLSAEGLADAGEGFRVDFSSQPPVVTDGPYAEAREV